MGQQTLYAIIAMMVMSLFAMQQQRHALRSQMDMIDQEINTIASSVATERLEEIGSKAFDEATAKEIITSKDELSPKSEFGKNKDANTTNDMDDHDGTEVTIVRTIGGSDLAFTTTATVDYTEDGNLDLPSANRSKYKIVTVTVTVNEGLDESLYSTEGLARKTITMSQTYACNSSCQF
jgi:hypothetical protein